METTNNRFQSFGDMLHKDYMFSFYGIIKCVQLLFSMCCFISASARIEYFGTVGASGWIQFVSILSFILSLIFYVLHTFRIDQSCPIHIPAVFIEFATSASLAFCYTIAGVVASCFITYKNVFFANFAAASFFSWSCCLLYGADAVALFIGWRSSSEGPFFSRSDHGNPA